MASHIICKSKLDLAVSVALGNKLFFHIVASANVATRILYWKKKLEIQGQSWQNVFERAIFQTLWKPDCCTTSLFLELKTSNFGYLTSVPVMFVVDTLVSYYCIYYEYYWNRRYLLIF